MSSIHRRRRLPVVALTFVALQLGAYLWWVLQSPHQRFAALADASTDLAHLERVPWQVLPASTIFSGNLFGYWAVVALVCLGALELVRGPVVTLVTGIVAHVIGTVVSQGVIAARIAAGDLSTHARHLLDVGPSYVVAACAAAVVASRRGPLWLRLVCALTLVPLLVTAFNFTPESQVAAIGHAVAILVGIGFARLPHRHEVQAAVAV